MNDPDHHLSRLRQNARQLRGAAMTVQRALLAGLHPGTNGCTEHQQTLLQDLTRLTYDAGRAYLSELDRRSEAAISRVRGSSKR